MIINAPLSFAGSAQRIMRIRRSADEGWGLVALTVLAAILIVLAWTFVLSWYLLWGLWLVPYRVLRRGARKRKAEALRHRELMGTIQGSAAGSAAAMVAAAVSESAPVLRPVGPAPTDLAADADRERLIEELGDHMLAGRLTAPEFEDRIGLAHAARTHAALEAIRRGLPAQPAQQPSQA